MSIDRLIEVLSSKNLEVKADHKHPKGHYLHKMNKYYKTAQKHYKDDNKVDGDKYYAMYKNAEKAYKDFE